MKKEIFQSDRRFVLYDYQASHGQLLLRSDKARGYEHTIDIIFFDATYVQLFAYLDAITIRKVENAGGFGYTSVSSYLSHKSNNLFEVETESGEKYFIAAAFFKVYENTLDFRHTSLGLAQPEGREKEIFSSI